MKKFIVLFSLLALGAFGVACSEDEETTDTTSADVVEEPPTSVITINDWVTSLPLEGVTVCVNLDGVDCVETDALGNATFEGGAENGTVVQLTADKEDYFPFLVEFTVTDATSMGTATYIMAKSDIVAVVTTSLGEEPDPDKGHVGVVAWGPADEDGTRLGLNGATVALDDGTAAQGPKYYNTLTDVADGAGIFDDEATTTTDAGTVGFFNVDTGVVSVSVTADGYDCTTVFNGLPSETSTLSGTVVAGRISYLVVFCETE